VDALVIVEVRLVAWFRILNLALGFSDFFLEHRKVLLALVSLLTLQLAMLVFRAHSFLVERLG